MANLGMKNGVYLARFRFGGQEYKRSLKTTDLKAARAAMHRVEDALHRLAINTLTVPAGVDAGDFIVSGGTLTAPRARFPRRAAVSVDEAIHEYQENLAHLAVSNRATVRGHLRNLTKSLKSKAVAPLDQVTPRDLEAFLQTRLRQRAHSTVKKERDTIMQFFCWCVATGYLGVSPAADLTKVKASGNLMAFKTLKEIEATVARGGLTPRQVLAMYDGLYLAPAEIAGLLELVRERARHDVSLVLHAIPAYTGMRRGEVMRLRWADIEFEQDHIVARSLKQSRQDVETMRRIDLHPELKAILLAWRDQRPSGQFVVCDARSYAPFTSRETSIRFFQPLRGTQWCLNNAKDWFKIGFHTYRHSFASNLAAAGVDQRIVDEWMGHQTEAMRKRYRHLFPKDKRSAIERFSLSAAKPPLNAPIKNG